MKQHIIYTRFSLISKVQEFWAVHKNNMDFNKYKELILDKSRLKNRCDIFINYQLPLLKMASEKYNIHQYVMTTQYLPEDIKDKILTAQDKYDFLHVDFFDENTLPNLKDYFINYLKNYDSNDIIACISRLDDDDLLHVDFFNHMQKYMEDSFIGFCVSFSNGYIALYNNGFVKFSKYRCLNNSVGLSYITNFKNKKFTTPHFTPPGNHMLIDTKVPCINDGTFNAFIYTLNGNNSSFNDICHTPQEALEKKFFKQIENIDDINDNYYNLFQEK